MILPTKYELISPEIAKMEPKGVLIFDEITRNWTPYVDEWGPGGDESKITLIAPLGTTAMLTTEAPKAGECYHYPLCTYHKTVHDDKCPAHPRNAMILVLPGWLARLKEKPEGLLYTTPQFEKGWTKPSIKGSETFAGWLAQDPQNFAYAVPRWVLDEIEGRGKAYLLPQTEGFDGRDSCQGRFEDSLSTQPVTTAPTNVPTVPVVPIQLVIKDWLNAADIREEDGRFPDYVRALRSVATQLSALIAMPVAGSGPTDGKMLNWLEKMDPHLSLRSYITQCLGISEAPTLRLAIADAMQKEGR